MDIRMDVDGWMDGYGLDQERQKCKQQSVAVERWSKKSGFPQGCSPKKEVRGRLKQDLDKDF